MLRDAMVRRQIALAHFERGLQQDIMSLLDDTEKDIRITLADRLAEIEGRDVALKGVNSKLAVLQRALQKIREGAFDEARSMWSESLEEVAKAEADFLDGSFKDVSPVTLDTVLPDAKELGGIVTSQPMQGKVLGDWVDSIESRDVERVMQAIRIGMTQGDTTDDIIRRVLGTKALDGTDGVVELTRREAASLTQTSISTVANEARQAYYEANSDIISKEAWAATLDDDTCPYCGDLDGEEFDVGEGEKPPAHFNCRCIRVPVIDGAAVGNRPANAAYEDELDGLDREERASRVAELVGSVPTTVAYDDWLGTQTEAFQDHVLGPTRAALFRDGELPLGKFVNVSGRSYTLDELRTREPEAFRRAGL